MKCLSRLGGQPVARLNQLPLWQAVRLKARCAIPSLKDQSDKFAKKATELSNQLEQTETHLRTIAGKTAITIPGDHCELSFERVKGEWYLMFRDTTEPDFHCPVTNVDIERKVVAAALLPELIKELYRAQNELLEEVEQGISSLSKISSLLGTMGEAK